MSELRIYTADECGADGYPFAWHDSIKDLIREQAGHRCVRCGHPYRSGSGEWSLCDERCLHRGPYRYRDSAEDEWYINHEAEDWILPAGEALEHSDAVEARWRILTVHHLNGNKADLRWWNLAALCQRCHLQIQGRVRMEQVYPHEHSEWFKPYAAGYYAATYLGEDLSRDETMERLDELLALELAA